MKNMLSLLALAGLVSVAAPAFAQELKGDVKAAEGKVAMCIGCHGIPGYQASFPEIHKVPMISGQNAKFLVNALVAYQKGERKHPTMRGIAGSLTEKEMADLGAFYEQHGRSSVVSVARTVKEPSAQVKALLDKGACASCHGVDYNKPIDGAYPKLAGQHSDYLYIALKSYKVEGMATLGRGNAIMAGQVKAFKPSELKAMADYIGSLPGDLKTVPQPRLR